MAELLKMATMAVGATISCGDLRGMNKWEGLLPGDKQRKCLDQSLRREILKYGELAQVTYDAFEYRQGSLFFGQAYWNANDLTKTLLRATSSGANKYECLIPKNREPNCNFIYAHPDVYFTTQQPKPRNGLDLDAVLKKYNDGIKVTSFKDAHWIGYIAVGPSTDGDPHGRDIVVAFRGTIMAQEWLVDFHIDMEEQEMELDERPKIHRGFLSWYSKKEFNYANRTLTPQIRVQNRLKSIIEEQLPDEGLKAKSITFVGHSLGGALAVIAARDIALCRLRGRVDRYYLPGEKGTVTESEEANKLKSALWSDISLTVFSFSAPRVGDLGFKNQLQKLKVPVLNVVNVRDIVPVLPDARITFRHLIKSPTTQWVHILTFLPALGWRLAPGEGAAAKRYEKEPWLWEQLIKLADFVFGTAYVNSGYKLYFDTRKVECLRAMSPWTLTADGDTRHNLEVLLYMVATQYTSDASPAEWRDVALMNKRGDHLDPYIAKELGIPVRWWAPIEHHHLAPRYHRTTDGSTLWRWRDKGAVEAFTQNQKGEISAGEIPSADPTVEGYSAKAR